LKKLQTQFVDPRYHYWLGSGGMAGIRTKLLRIDFNVLRSAVEKLPLVNAIINTRIDQALPFCEFTDNENDKGYQIVPVDADATTKAIDKKKTKQLREFVEQTGFAYDELREDDLLDFVTGVIRETYTVDQIATELQYNRKNEVCAFWGLDGTTIRRVEENSEFERGIRFVQQIEEQIYNSYKASNLIFDYKWKRFDIRYRGFGYSPVEQSIDVITTLLFGYNYIRDQLVKDKMPRGFISVMGDVGKEQLDSIRNYWYAAMSGMGGQWNIPILPSGKDGVGMDFKLLGQTNKDMEFHRTLMFVSSLIAACFGIDLLEMGIKSDDSQAVIGENSFNRISVSKERGLRSILMYVQQHLNKVIRKVSTDYRFRFCGIEPEDLEKKSKIREAEVATHKSVDELRIEDGLDPFDEEWSRIPANPTIVQLYINLKQMDQMAQQQQQMGQQGEEGEGGGQGEEGAQGGEGQQQQQQRGNGAPGAGGENPSQYMGGNKPGFPMFGKSLGVNPTLLRVQRDRLMKRMQEASGRPPAKVFLIG
jgi:hypothetical protein